MIFGHIDHIPTYISPQLQEALKHLKSLDFSQLEKGKTQIKGDDHFIMVVEYDTNDPKVAEPEDHDQYIDVQFIYEGEECFGYKYDSQDLTISQPYDEGRDIRFYEPTNLCDMLSFKAKDFIIVFPGEVHSPGLHPREGQTYVKKIVAKLHMDLLK